MYNMSFLAGFSDTDYYSVASAAGMNDQDYTIGAVVLVGRSLGVEAIFSSLGTNTGYELRTGGGVWTGNPNHTIDTAQSFGGQAGVTSLGMNEAAQGIPSAQSRIMFVAMSAKDNAQTLYVNAIPMAETDAPAPAAAVGGVFIGNRPGLGVPATNVYINTVFYATDALSEAELMTVYRWIQAYGRLPDDGTGGGILAGITHFWDLLDNRSAAAASWVSRGVTGGITMSLTGSLSIASSGHAIWGW